MQVVGIGLVMFGIVFPSLVTVSALNPQPGNQGCNRDGQAI